MASLKLGKVAVNEEGWGPVDVPEDLVNVPFAPFTKQDRLGKACDWTQGAYTRAQAGGKYGVTNNVFNFAMDNEDSNFHLVDSRPTRTKPFGPRRNQFQHRNRNADKDDYRSLHPGGKPEHDRSRQKKQQQQQQQHRGRFWHEQRNTVQYSPSIDIRPEWSVLEQVQVPLFAKMSLTVPEPEDYLQAGRLFYYDRATDRVSPQARITLGKAPPPPPSVTASDDPILKRISEEGKAQVFITDSVLAAIMCTPRAVYSWDVVITRRGNQLWFDKRPGTVLDQESVNETAPEGVQEDDSANGVAALAREATAIRQTFSQQCLDRSQTHDLGAPDPFAPQQPNGQEPSTAAYHYRIWDLGDDVKLAARCALDAVLHRQGTDYLLTTRTFNQAAIGPSDVDWKRKLEHQSAAVLAMEVKNNSNRVARWTLSTILAGADLMKIGLVARVTPKDNSSHVLLATSQQKPRDFAQQLNIKMSNCWAIVKHIVDLCLRLEKDHYVLMKDPNKQLMYLYEVPAKVAAAASSSYAGGDDDDDDAQ